MNKKIIVSGIVILTLLIITGIATILVQTPTQTTTRATLNLNYPTWEFKGKTAENWVGAGLKNLIVKNSALQGTIVTTPAYLYSPPRLLIGKEKSQSNKITIKMSLEKKPKDPEKINFTLALSYLTNKNNNWENTTPQTKKVTNFFTQEAYEFILPLLPQDEYITAFRLGFRDIKDHLLIVKSIKVE
jgi:hypothetical protein